MPGTILVLYQMNAPDMDPLDEDDVVVPVRERILDAALQLIQLHGLHAMSQAKVCEMAGVRHSHLTYYFPTRVKLLKEVVMRGLKPCWPCWMVQKTSVRVRWARCVPPCLELPSNRGLSRMMVAVYVVSDEEPSLRPWMDKFQMNGLQRVKRALEAIGINPPQRAVEAFWPV